MKEATRRARRWQTHAVPVAFEFEYLDPPNPKMKGPHVKLSCLSR
jgi:hypothetical protein